MICSWSLLFISSDFQSVCFNSWEVWLQTRILFYSCCCCKVTSVVSNSVRPHRWQPTRLLCPWYSPGKNTGVGCHFLLQCMKVKSESEVAQSCPTLHDPMDCSLPGSSIHGIFQARVLEWVAIAFSDYSCRGATIRKFPQSFLPITEYLNFCCLSNNFLSWSNLS